MTLPLPGRNSVWWWIGSLSGATLALAAHTDLLRKAFPALPAERQAQIELCAFIGAWLSAHAAWSPLPLKALDPTPVAGALPAPPDLPPMTDVGRFQRELPEH